MRWVRRLVRSWRAFVVGLLAAAFAFAPVALSPARAESDGVIDIDLNAAPDIEQLVEVRLVSGDEDVTDRYCRPAEPETGVVLTCSGLPSGLYDVATIGVPDGLRMTVNCINEVASRSLPPVIVGPSSPPWRCTSFVGSPAVLLSVNSLGGPWLDAGTLELVPVEGVTPDCVDDVVNNSPATRCRNLPLGTYEVRVTDVPDTAIVREPFCQAQVFADDADYPFGPAAVLTDERWLWWCDVDILPPAVIGLVSTSGERPDPDGVGLRVTGPDGDVTPQCAFFGSADEPGRWYWSCDLPVGSYTVAFDGVPAEDVVESCEAFDVAIGQSAVVTCLWTIRVASAAPPTEVSPPSSTGGGVLPATGGSTHHTIWLAALTLIAGVIFVAVARRATGTRDDALTTFDDRCRPG